LRTTLYIGEWKVDQFGDEAATVVSSVLDITDITKNTGDYTKTFTVPASKRNNILFKHWYDANIDNSFDARTKIDGRIELDYIPFKSGKWRLSKVSVKKNKPSSYTINFFGKLPSLKEIVKKDYLTDLNLSAYDHDYDSANVELGLKSGLFSLDIIYTLFVKKQYYYNDNASDNTQTDSLANIAWGGGSNTGVIWNDLRASIKMIRIIEAIESKYSIVFSRDFFGTSEFTNLYMWLNPDKDKNPGGDINVVDWFYSANDYWMNLTTDVGSYEVINTPASGDSRYFELSCIIHPEPGFGTVPYTVISVKDGSEEVTSEHTGDNDANPNFTVLLPQGNDSGTTHLMQWKVLSEEEFQYRAVLVQKEFTNAYPNTAVRTDETTAGVNINESIFVISEELPKMKIIDFIKGLLNMFKLVIVAQDDGSYYINTLNGFYSEGELYDVTKHIEFNSFDVERGVILNEIELKFKEPTTILNIEFEKNNRRGYGDIETTLTDEQDPITGEEIGNLLDGDSLTFELPFEQILYERLTDQVDDSITKIQYGAIIDEDREPANPAAHIFYSSFTSINSSSIAFIRDTGTRIILNNFIWTAFHHSGTLQPNYSTLFNAEFSTWDGVVVNNNLYSRHYADYISTIFNIKKRTFKYTAHLPIHIITKLELNDILKIKENYYRIDKYSYNLLTGKTDLNLVNSFDNTINPTRSQEESIFVDYRAQTETILITNSDAVVPTKIDQGYGTSWITLTATGDNKHIAFDEFGTETGARRVMFLEYTSSGESVFVFLSQSDKGKKALTFDSDQIKFDSDIITWDQNLT